MLALALLFAQNLTNPLRDHPTVGFGGIPQIASPNLSIVSHTVTITVLKDLVDVSSVTLFKNNGPAGAYTVNIPVGFVGNAPAPTGITATWVNSPIGLTPPTSDNQAYTGKVAVQNLGSYAVRVHFTERAGYVGVDQIKRLVAYNIHSSSTIGTLMVTYAFAQGVVFNLPDVGPGHSWEVGTRGAFLKRENYAGRTGLTYCAFYPAGFNTPLGR